MVTWGDPPSKWKVSRTVSWLLPTGTGFFKEAGTVHPARGLEQLSVVSSHRGLNTHWWPPHTEGSVLETQQDEKAGERETITAVKEQKHIKDYSGQQAGSE